MEVETTGGMEVSGGQPSPEITSPNDPQPIEINEDSFVKLPGQEKPVKYGDYYKGFQSEFTRKSQAAAELQRKYDEVARKNQEYEARLRQLAEQAGGRRPEQPSGPSLAEKVKSLPYLDGAAAAEVVQELTGQFGRFEEAIRQRDAVLYQMAQHMKRQNDALNGIQSQSSSQAFEGKVNKWISDMGLPPEAKDLATEIYLAYEGDDLDQEFPTIFKQRWEQIANLVRTLDKKKVEQARSLPFTPGKGGNGTPSKPLNQGFRPAREIADELWDSMNG